MLGDPALVNPDGPDVAAPARASELGDWSEVAAGERYACARRGTDVWCWGTARAGGIGDGRWQSSRGFARVLGDATALSIGWNATAADPGLDEGDYDLTCAVQDGAVACWGDNRSGQLGQGTATRSPLPVELAGGLQWDSIVAGDAHACGIANGTALCWGSAELGQVRGVAMGAGSPCTAASCDVGVPQPILDQVSSVVAGAAHTCALRGSSVECWGSNRAGQCGATPSPAVQPTVVAGTWDNLLGAGARGTCAATGAQTWCWGTALATHEPEHDAVLDGARTVALDDNFGCALVPTSNGTPSNDGGLGGPGTGQLVCFGGAIGVFGNGATGTCGDGTCNANETADTCAGDCGAPPLTHLGRTYAAIAIGRRAYTCGLRGDGGIECWGDNLYGQSGQHTGNQLVHPVPLPFTMPGLASCTQITTGAQHVCALCNGELACWGDASHGELGFPVTHDPITAPRTINVPLVGDHWVEVAAGDGFTCGRTETGRGYCWGTSLHGALGNGATSANLPVLVEH